jgi:hypothetical protein
VRLPLLLLLFAAGASAEGKFASRDEAEAAVRKARSDALTALEKESLPIPEVFLEADGVRHSAERANFLNEALPFYEGAFGLYGQSVGKAREELAALPPEKRPGTRSTQQRAADAALAWLEAHEDPIGRWDAKGFMKHDPEDDKCDGAGDNGYDIGVTALAALAFLESGASVDRPEVHHAIQWLRAQQDAQGLLGSSRTHQYVYNHAIATLALAEAYAQTKDVRQLAQLRPALDFILRAQNPGAGWRYDPRGGETDTSVTCWCFRALAKAADAGVQLDLTAATAGARAWITSRTSADGVTGYNLAGGAVARPEGKDRFPPERSRAMTAAGVVLRLLLDDKPDRKLLQASLDRCLECPPDWDPDAGSIDMYYWYLGTLACESDKGRARKWKKPLLDAVLKHQHPKGSGARVGSFDPIGVWGAEGGRVYATAILALALAHAG